MRIGLLFLLLLLAPFGDARASASGVTAPVDGSCESTAEAGLAEMSDVLDQAWSAAHPDPRAALEALARDQASLKEREAFQLPKCVAEDDPAREARERREIERIEEAVKLAAKDKCMKSTCVGNATYLATGYSHNFFDFFGGCENWSRLTAETIGGTLQYHTIEREQRCNFPGHCHYVVVLRNERTGVVRTVDAWAYAGGWVFGGVSDENKSVFGDYDEFKRRYGLRTDHEAIFGKAQCD